MKYIVYKDNACSDSFWYFVSRVWSPALLTADQSLLTSCLCLCLQVSSSCYGGFEMGGLDGVWAAILPAADRPHSSAFSSPGWGRAWIPDETLHFPSLRQWLNSSMNTSSTQICTCHQLLHPQVLQLLIKLFETEHSQLDVMEQVCCVSLILLQL